MLRSELVKSAVWVSGLAMIILIEEVPCRAAALVSAVHLLLVGLPGYCVLRLAGLKLPDSMMDQLGLAYFSGWAILPLWITPLYAIGGISGWSIGIMAVIMALTVRILCKKQVRQAPAKGTPHNIPATVYLVAGLYAFISVAMPFHFFSAQSIVREMYGDGIQRFGLIYALAQGLPPENPFFAGAPLIYYWFSFVPYAVEFRLAHTELFHVWKSGQTWTALLCMPGLWYVVQAIFRHRAVSWAAVLFGFVFASFEILADTNLLQSLICLIPTIFKGLCAPGHQVLANLHMPDPDMVLGIITRYSDQLFVEDFLYVPQNMYAMMALFTALWFMEEGKQWAAILSISSLAGINTFFLLPCSAAFCLMILARSGILPALSAAGLIIAYSFLWCTTCGIISQAAWRLALAVAVFATGLYLWSGRFSMMTQVTDRDLIGPLRQAAWFFLFSLALVVLLRPWANGKALFFNYAPALAVGVIFLLHMAVSKRPIVENYGRCTLLFLLLSCAFYEMITFIIYLQFVEAVPAFVREWASILGQKVNLFNFYHKVGKLTRFTWAILAGISLSVWGRQLLELLQRRPFLYPVLGLVLAASVITSALRPVTYLRPGTLAEGPAADYLIAHGNGLRTTVLIEDFRHSAINQLLPVSVFFYSTWSDGNPGLTHAVGSWVDQYLPVRFHEASKKREEQNRWFFSDAASEEDRRLWLKENNIQYILTRKEYSLSAIAVQVVRHQGGNLYRVISAFSHPGQPIT